MHEVAQELIASMSSLHVQKIQHNSSLLHALCRQFLIQGCRYTIAGSVIILVAKEKEKNYFKRGIDSGWC